MNDQLFFDTEDGEKEEKNNENKRLGKTMDSNTSEYLKEKLSEKYQNLNYIRSEKAKWTILRSKITIYEENEKKPSKYSVVWNVVTM